MIQAVTSLESLPGASRRRVLHVVNGQHYAGAARVQDLLADSLPTFGYDVSFACVLPGRFETERKSQQSEVFNVPMKHRMDFGPAREIARIVRTGGFELLHSHTTRSAMIAAAAAKLTDVPYVHHVHCQMNTEVDQRMKSFVNASIERFACRQANHVIAVSNSIRRFLLNNGFTKTPIKVVPNGVPTPNQCRPDRIAAPQWTIGMVALLRERKGLETLLHALPELRRTSDVRLRIVGPFETDAYERRMLALADSLGIAQHIDWVGFTNDVNEQLMQMDALVLPSVLPEGMPMVLLEALAAGVPIVGSRVDGIIDVIRHDQNGLLAEPANASSLASQLHRLITGEVCWQQLRNQGLRDYRHCFSNRAMGSGVAAVYDLILSEQDLKSARRLNQELAT